MFDSVRLRLTLWYVGVLSLILLSFSIAIYIFVGRSLYEALDASLYSTLGAVSAALKRQGATGEISNEAMARVLQELHTPGQAIAIFDERGQLFAQKAGDGPIHVRLPSSGIGSFNTTSLYSLPEQDSESDDSCRGIVGHVRVPPRDASYTIVVNQSLEPVSDHLDLLQDILYVAVPLALTVAGLGGWFLARRSLRPVVTMSARAQRISAENLDQRLPVANPRDELGGLAATFNELLARLGNSFSQQRQFMTDASHELRTPLSVIRTTSAVTLQREDRDKSEYREALTIVEQQARRLSRIVEDMFVLARADAGHPTLQITEFYLDELLAETTRAAAVLASQKNLQLEEPSLPEAPFRGDEELLRQMLWNLLDNAVKYTPRGGTVRIALVSGNAEYVVTVSDSGGGISPEIQPHIFERFYRADKARSRAETANEGGAGLGLPIARWIAEAHHGRLELQRSDETGSTFVVFLPRA
jgi:two-component system OmpR family sensor kinase